MSTLVHLVRHAEVENPDGVWYGRLEGFPLSGRGRRQAEALAEHFSVREIAAVYSSPLTRAAETAEAIAAPHSLSVSLEPDLIETETHLQGKPGDGRLFRNPMNIRYFLNPFRPSWGESYRSVSRRMLRAIERMRSRHEGEEVVAVSHMTPIVVARIRLEGRGIPAWMAGVACGRGSVTTIEFDEGQVAGVEYEPIGRSIE